MLIPLLPLFLLFSCAGYQSDERDNPLAQYGIHSLSIPQFVNYSNMNGVAKILTRKFSLLFSKYKGLRLYNGEDSRADAVLVGVVDGPRRVRDTLTATQMRFTTGGGLRRSIGGRREFAVPSGARYRLMVRISVIKNPTYGDKKPGAVSPRFVIDENLPFRGSYHVVALETTNSDSLGIVNFTKNRASAQQSVVRVADDFTKNFEEVVLNAF